MEKPGISIADLIAWLGGPGAMMAVFTWLIIKGFIVTAREMRQREALKDRIIEIQAKQIADKERELESKQVEALRWRDNAFDNMRDLRDAHVAIRTLMRKIPKLKADDTHDEGEGEGPC